MAKEFADRVEEVLGLLHGMAWPILDEADKQKIVGKVVRNIDKYGDSVNGWARALACDESTLRRRIERFRRSEPVDSPRATKENERKRLSHARSVLKDPELVAKVMEDPTARRNIARAAVEHQAIIEADEHAAQRERVPGLTHRAGFNDVAGDLLRVRRMYAAALERTRHLDLSAEEADALRSDLDQIAAITDWYRSFLSSGASDFDTELDRLLEG